MQRPMMGAAAHGMAGVRTALEMLQKALPGLPMGSELHTAVLKAVTDLSRRLETGSGGGDHAGQTQILAQAARENQSNPMAAAMQRMQQQPQPPNPPEQPQQGQ